MRSPLRLQSASGTGQVTPAPPHHPLPAGLSRGENNACCTELKERREEWVQITWLLADAGHPSP